MLIVEILRPKLYEWWKPNTCNQQTQHLRYTGRTSDDFGPLCAHIFQAKGVPPTAVRWDAIRAEHYLQAFVHKRLADHSPEDVTTYLEKLGKNRQHCRLAISPDD